ncbi:MAG: hypothetical protein M1831_000509 [Alyxoria varia]|nr:MAG: hypothetical protein M1831_000509 [Alyxoria varia]
MEPLDRERTLGQAIPPDTPHAVSVSLPTWRSNVGYEEGWPSVVKRMTTGYPRFFVHKTISSFADLLLQHHGSSTSSSSSDQAAMLFPTHVAAARCLRFISEQSAPEQRPKGGETRILDFVPTPAFKKADPQMEKAVRISAAVYPSRLGSLAKSFWQHTGEGVTSRRAEYCRRMYEDGCLVEKSKAQDAERVQCKGPRRYRKEASTGDVPLVNGFAAHVNGGTNGMVDQAKFVEERFGRNLNVDMADKANLAIRRRIAGTLTDDVELDQGGGARAASTASDGVARVSEDDVYLYPGGMNSIFHTHQNLMAVRGDLRSVCFGFPYIDTLKVLEKFTSKGALFYGHGSATDLSSLEMHLQHTSEKILALFCEFPSNPLLKCPDLRRIRELADRHDFAVVVDETIGNWLNVEILPWADVIVSSLTKVFSGDSNVMGGSAVLNPSGRYYAKLKEVWDRGRLDDDSADDATGSSPTRTTNGIPAHNNTPDSQKRKTQPSADTSTLFPFDILTLERNSRDFIPRNSRINANALSIARLLKSSPYVKAVYYPHPDIHPDPDAAAVYETYRRKGKGPAAKPAADESANGVSTKAESTSGNSDQQNHGGTGPSSESSQQNHRATGTPQNPDAQKHGGTEPPHSPTPHTHGGYTPLLSLTFHNPTHAPIFYDNLPSHIIHKGPSLGTNFTLVSPFVLLAHYNEMEWARGFGVEGELVRVSVGLEDEGVLMGAFEGALAAVGRVVAEAEKGGEGGR